METSVENVSNKVEKIYEEITNLQQKIAQMRNRNELLRKKAKTMNSDINHLERYSTSLKVDEVCKENNVSETLEVLITQSKQLFKLVQQIEADCSETQLQG